MDMKRKRIFKFLPLLLLMAGALFVASCSDDDVEIVDIPSAPIPFKEIGSASDYPGTVHYDTAHKQWMIRCSSKDYSDSLTFDIKGEFDDTYKVENLPIEFSGSIIKDTQVDRKQLPTGHLIVSLNKVKMPSSNENGSLFISLGEQPQGTETLSDLSYFNDPSQHDVKGRLTVNFDFFYSSIWFTHRWFKTYVEPQTPKLKPVNVRMEREGDDTLVLRLEENQRTPYDNQVTCIFSVHVVNAVRDSYYIRYNPHKVMEHDADGTEHEREICDFEGRVRRGQEFTIDLIQSY